MTKLVGWIDGLLMRLARWMITAGAFFGISRWRLIVCSIVTSWTLLEVMQILMFPEMLRAPGKGAVAVAIFVVLVTMWVANARSQYREDDVFSGSLADYAIPEQRLRHVLVLPILALLIGMIEGQFHLLWMALFSPEFHIYLLLQQDPRNPLRFRTFMRDLTRSILGNPQTQ